MIVRDLRITDLPLLYSYHDNKFPFPDLENKLYMIKKVAEKDGQVLGTGIVRLTSEAILILDQTLPRATRARATVALADQMLHDAVASGMDECHIFVREPNVQQFMRHLGFKNSLGGQAMIFHF